MAFAKRRKEQRISRGCLTLASAEVKFEFDSETHENITDVHEYRLFETNSMVEEMMLLANEAVAAKIFSAFPACALLRNHPIPHPNMLVPLQNLAALFDIPLDTRSNKVNSGMQASTRRPTSPRCTADVGRVTFRRQRSQRPVRLKADEHLRHTLHAAGHGRLPRRH